MVHIIAFLIIAAAKVIKWTLIKSRLFIAAVPISIVHIFFIDWYESNALLADSIGIILIVGVVVSWVVSLIRYIRVRKRNKGLIIDWAYERYGKPKALIRKTSKQPI